MPNPQYQARLPNDIARGVEQYAEEEDVSKSEIIRRSVTRFLEEEGYPHDEGEKPMPDGGTEPVTRGALRDIRLGALIAAAISLLLTKAGLVTVVLALSVTLVTLVAVLAASLLLLTPLPEMADAWSRRRLRPLSRRLEVDL